MVRFDFDQTFGDDYLHFYLPHLADEQNDADAAVVIERLGLQGGELVLDAPCGHGRISNRLAAAGHRVTAVDITPHFLEVAVADAASLGVEVDYRAGDIRTLPVDDASVDAAVSWFTSFGYFDDDDNQLVLREYARVLRPGGRLLVETMARDNILRRYTEAPEAHVVEVGDDLQVDHSLFDPMTGRIGTDRTIVRDGQVRRGHHSVRLLTISEWHTWLDAAGFDDVKTTDQEGGPVTMETRRLVVVATRRP
ncbi:MAG: hypothetical protein QOE63_1375 [Acidimicrobiaceae bacterium]